MNILFPGLLAYHDLALLFLRVVVAVVFVWSGVTHLKDPAGRAKSIEMSVGFTVVLGLGEVAGGLGVAFGVLIQLAAIALILVMLGAILKKVVKWKTGFWGEHGYGWHYDTMLAVMNLVIMTSGGGRFVLG